jgi:hypothetical protein
MNSMRRTAVGMIAFCGIATAILAVLVGADLPSIARAAGYSVALSALLARWALANHQA